MVIKTVSCFYSEYKIYPGRGVQFVRKDGKLVSFLSPKMASLYMQKIKAQKLTWSQQWRRINKKGAVNVGQRKKTKVRTVAFKSVPGMSVDDIKKSRSLKPEFKKATREQQLKEIKARKTKAQKSVGAARYNNT
jgi:large subunit ribosomal protein L24e